MNMTFTETRIGVQLIRETLEEELLEYHTEIPESMFNDGDLNRAFESIIPHLKATETYIKRIESLLSERESSTVFIKRLREEIESIPGVQISAQESLNQRLVVELLEDEISALRQENEALKAQAALLEEVPFHKVSNQ